PRGLQPLRRTRGLAAGIARSGHPAPPPAHAPETGPGLFVRLHVHPHPDRVAGVVVGARGIGAAGILPGHVIGADAAVVDRVVAVACRHRVADRHHAVARVAVALAALVDLAPGHAADHRTDRRRRVARRAAADLAAQHGADHATHDRGDVAPGIAAAADIAIT